jgi:DNA-binding NtrC family response regulator
MAYFQPQNVKDIVVIDDDRLICELIVNALASSGAAVQCVTRGRSGRKLLVGKRFDLAIIDVILPDASGIALAAIAANENTPVLLITGHPNGTARLKHYDLLDLPCLLKPFDLVRLRTEAERVMAESRRNIQQIRDGMVRWRANLAAWEDVMANSRRLIEDSRRLTGKATASEPTGE